MRFKPVFNSGIRAEINHNPELRQTLARHQGQPCILCGSRPYANAVFAPPHDHELCQGLKPGQGRYYPYGICRRCGSMPGWEQRVEARLVEIFRQGGARKV